MKPKLTPEQKAKKKIMVDKAKVVRRRAKSAPHIYKEGARRRANIKSARQGVKSARRMFKSKRT